MPGHWRDLVIDNDKAELKGPWVDQQRDAPSRWSRRIVHDDNAAKGECIARYTFQVAKPGRYLVRVSWPPNPNRATNVPVTIHFGDGDSKTVTVNQKESGSDGFNSLGQFAIEKSAVVEISNKGTNGYVIADAVQLLSPGEVPKKDSPKESLPRKQSNKTSTHWSRIAAVGEDSPNILLLFADDLGYEALGCYGGKDFQTPHLDRLAEQGMRFSRAYTSPVCTPSRMSLYTGTYTTRHGYDSVLPVHTGTQKAVDFQQQWATYPQLLREAGYRTSVTGKWQLAALEFHPEHCRDAGFDSWCVWQIWRDGKKTTRYWQPCFNHDGKIRKDIQDRFGPDVLADYVIEKMRSAVSAKRPFYIHHNMLLPHWPIIQTPTEKASGKPASVDGMIASMDRLCGRIIDEVDRLGIAENTVIIFMGDNGTDLNRPRQTTAGEVVGKKTDLNDAGTHIPLIVRWPANVKAGEVAADLIDMADLFPTICDVAGVEIPASIDVDGVSFAPRLRDGVPSTRKWVTAGIDGKVSLFDGQWRYNVGTRQVIDARRLPTETIVDESPEEAQVNLQRLREAANMITAATP